MTWVISGVVNDASGLAARLVRLYLSSDGSFVAEQTSNATTGVYEFSGLNSAALYDVIAFDPTYPVGGALIFTNVAPVNTNPAAGAHRYWRINALVCPSSVLELSEIRVFEGASDVTAAATYTGSTLQGGTFAAWQDGNTATSAFWFNNITTKELLLDFGAGNDKAIDGVKQGGYDSSARYMSGFALSSSDDGISYNVLGTKSGLTYPGNFTLSALYTFP